MTNEEIRARTWALVATAADGRHEDIDALLSDLDDDDLGSVVGGLAGLAVMALMPDRADARHDGARAQVADRLRTELLHQAGGPHGDDAA
ncbi:hypothetical protein ACIBM4_14255 [Streptomyces sp. NPDC050256]|uniref:hypothetical protein n=1 Tax=Streptomyces sp. NPDC050256 TaxID=3365607 RepID=UPI003792A751